MWRDRLRTEHSISSLLDWADTLPTLSLLALSERLPVRIAPIYLLGELCNEAHEKDVFAAFARSWMVRRFYGEDAWSELFDRDKVDAATVLLARVDATRDANPNWRPSSKDDRLLREVFSGVDLTRSSHVTRVAVVFARIAEALDAHSGEGLYSFYSSLRAHLPLGFSWVASMRCVDAEVCNGGFAQFFANRNDDAIGGAIDGFSACRHDAAKIIANATATTDKRAWTRLDNAWYALRPSVNDVTEQLLHERPELFEATTFELMHDDGRRWRVRAFGSTLDIEIVFPDERVTRSRKLESAAVALAEAKRLLAEQLQDGFVQAQGNSAVGAT
jgi:hypothetical protein